MLIDGNLMLFVILGGLMAVILALYLMFRRTVLAFSEGVDERR
jgi:hypothetical protein